MKRQRGRNRRPNNSGNNNSNNPNRSYDSNGPDVKVRGNAKTVYEKYTTLARDAASSGSRVKAENYLQHAEHYLRIMKEQQEKQQLVQEQRAAEQEARREKEAKKRGDNTDKDQEKKESVQAEKKVKLKSESKSDKLREGDEQKPKAKTRKKLSDEAAKDVIDTDHALITTKKPRRKKTETKILADVEPGENLSAAE